ncbi:MAG: hypothetical protein ACREX4_21990 [Gammaproteobacteria bacterium]
MIHQQRFCQFAMLAEHCNQLLGALVAEHTVAPKARSLEDKLGWALVALRDLPASAIPELLNKMSPTREAKIQASSQAR